MSVVITNLLSGLGRGRGKLNAYFNDVRGPTMVRSNATENFSNFTPLDCPKRQLPGKTFADYYSDQLRIREKSRMKSKIESKELLEKCSS